MDGWLFWFGWMDGWSGRDGGDGGKCLGREEGREGFSLLCFTLLDQPASQAGNSAGNFFFCFFFGLSDYFTRRRGDFSIPLDFAGIIYLERGISDFGAWKTRKVGCGCYKDLEFYKGNR